MTKLLWSCTHQAHIIQNFENFQIFKILFRIKICLNHVKICWFEAHEAHNCENSFTQIIFKYQSSTVTIVFSGEVAGYISSKVNRRHLQRKHKSLQNQYQNNSMKCQIITQIVTISGSTLKGMSSSFRSHNTCFLAGGDSVGAFFVFGWKFGFPSMSKKSWGRGGMQLPSKSTISQGISTPWHRVERGSYGRLHMLHIYSRLLYPFLLPFSLHDRSENHLLQRVNPSCFMKKCKQTEWTHWTRWFWKIHLERCLNCMYAMN